MEVRKTKGQRLKTLWLLFADMFRIALFVVGGGFAILAVADEVFARKRKWTKEGEILDRLPVFQMVPGVIAGHTAVYIGRKMAGPLGAAAALAGTLLPSLIVFSLVTHCYRQIPTANPYLAAAFAGLRAALAGMVGAILVRSWTKNVRGACGYAGMAVATVLIGGGFVPPALVIAAAALVGIVAEYARRAHARGACLCGGALGMLPLVFLKYGCVAFGGGYVLVPLYLTDFVGPAAPYLQLPLNEFADVMALTQMTPGPIAINCATFFGQRMGGISGAVLATVALILPGFILLQVMLRSLDRYQNHPFVVGLLNGIRPVTVALMLVAGWSFLSLSAWSSPDGKVVVNPVACVLVAFTLWAFYRRRFGVVRLVLASAVIAVLMRCLAPGLLGG